MSGQTMQFVDGKSYETMMGLWSAEVGNAFLDWLDVPAGKRWVDVGCGNGASTELLVRRVAPAQIEALDPSAQQLDFARQRHTSGVANFRIGTADDLPFSDDEFDVALMALVIFFVPDAKAAVDEMVRVVRQGGKVTAYAWDILGGGFPYEAIHRAMSATGITPILPPHPEAADLAVLEKLWTAAGLADVATKTIHVSRVYPTFDEYWAVSTSAPGISQVLNQLGAQDVAGIRSRAQR
ncbi:MAG TPA: class I SAM-dependent methyltransferase [Devosia sp.]|nr:class I SAM-dependent methyltransferase [Devosia sp.]